MIRLFLLSICFSCSVWLAAQPSEPADSIWQRITMEDVVVTAQYAPSHPSQAVHQIRVIEALDIQQQGLNNLAEVLTNQLNLRVSSDPFLGNGLRIQGIGGENVQILIDGVPVIGRQGGNIDLSQINLQNVERIELIEGAMSVQYGSNASGGVVNIITRKSQGKRFQVESQNQYENAGILNNSLSLGWQSDKLYASIRGSRFHSQFAPEDSLRLFETVELPSGETFRRKKTPWNPKTQYGVDGTLRYFITDSFNLTYQYRFFDEVLTSFGEVRRPQFRPYAIDDYFQTQRRDHSLSLEAYIKPRFYLQSTTAYNCYDRESRTERLDFDNDSTSLVDGAQDTSIFTSLLHRSTLGYLGSGKWSGQLGLEVFHETGTGGRIIDSTSSPTDRATLTNYAAWLSLQYEPWSGFVFQGNLRYGYNTKYDHPLVPSFHAKMNLLPELNLTMSYALGFRAPSLKELYFNFIDINHFIIGNPELRAEKSHNAMLSLAYQADIRPEHEFSLEAKAFLNNIRDRIVLAEFAPIQFNYQNIDQFNTRGFNLIGQYAFLNHLQLKSGFAYTFLYNPYSESFDTKSYTGLPELQNELHGHIPFLETDLVVVHRYFGRQVRFFENGDGLLEQGFIGQYHLLNLSLSRSFWSDRLFLSAGVKNLLDTQDVPINGQGDGGAHGSAGNTQLLGWGRTYFVRLNLSVGF